MLYEQVEKAVHCFTNTLCTLDRVSGARLGRCDISELDLRTFLNCLSMMTQLSKLYNTAETIPLGPNHTNMVHSGHLF